MDTTTNLDNASELHHRWSVLNHALALYGMHSRGQQAQAKAQDALAACNACDATGQLAVLFLERNAAWLAHERNRDANAARQLEQQNPVHLQRTFARYLTAQCELDRALAPLRTAALQAGGAVFQAVLEGRY